MTLEVIKDHGLEIKKSDVHTYGEVHVNVPLSNISIAYIQDQSKFVAPQVFPQIPVTNQANSYYTYNIGQFSTDEVQERAPNTQTQGITLRPSTDSYNCRVYGLHIDIPDEIRMNSDSQVNLDRAVTIALTERAMLQKERHWITNFFGDGKWDGFSEPEPSWESSTANPVKDMRDYSRMMLKATGYRPNMGIIAPELLDALLEHTNIIGRFDRGQTPGGPARAGVDQLASLFNLDRVMPLEAIYNKDPDPDSDDMDFTVGAFDEDMLLLYVPPSPGMMTPSAGYTFNWTRYTRANDRGIRVRKFRMEAQQADRVEILMSYDMKKTGNSLGLYIKNALT